jgi:hypothetical protein
MSQEQQIEKELRNLVARDSTGKQLWEYIKNEQDKGLDGVMAYLIVECIHNDYIALRASNAQEAARPEYKAKMALEWLAEQIWYNPRNNLDVNWPYTEKWPFENGYPWQNKTKEE